MPTPLIIVLSLLAAAIAGTAAVALLRRRRESRLRDVLDLADAVQALLAKAGQRMTAWRGTVAQLAGDLGNGAQRALDAEALIVWAKRDLLQHRLWLQQRGLDASSAELAEAASALLRVRDRLTRQLSELENAGSALTEATDGARATAQREPPSLRRGLL